MRALLSLSTYNGVGNTESLAWDWERETGRGRRAKRQRVACAPAAVARRSPATRAPATESKEKEDLECSSGLPSTRKSRGAFASLQLAFETPMTSLRFISAEVGRGLFADAAFAKGDYITQFTGEMITRSKADRRPCKRFMVSFGHALVIDTCRNFEDVAKRASRGSSAYGYAQYANHQPDPSLLNAKVDTLVIGPRRTQRTYPNTVWLRATRDINPGDQILYSYGKSFQAHHPGPVAPLRARCGPVRRSTRACVLFACESI